MTRARRRARRSRHARLCPRPPLRAEEVGERRRRLRRARRHLERIETRNRYQRELKGTALALVRHLEEHWRTPGWRDDYESWWPVINRYADALVHDGFTGHGASRRFQALLDRNQVRPMDL